MNTKNALCIFIFSLCITCLHGQKISYSYDDNGNRTGRTLFVAQLKPGSVQFPVANSKNKLEEYQIEKLTQGELTTLVYPNPNKGLIKIDIAYMPLNSITEARLYALSGIELMVKKNFGSYYEMDISRLKDGIYILRIKVNEKIFDWKVIKSNR
jgi:hypothetical protein